MDASDQFDPAEWDVIAEVLDTAGDTEKIVADVVAHRVTRDVALRTFGSGENHVLTLEPLALTVLVDGLREADRIRSEAS